MKKKVKKIKNEIGIKISDEEVHEIWVENLDSCDFEDNMGEFVDK